MISSEIRPVIWNGNGTVNVVVVVVVVCARWIYPC